MAGLETIFILLFAAVLLVGVAQHFHIPYPLALVISGTAIGFLPGLHTIHFDSNLVLVIVLPPILYYAAFGIPFREFKQNWREIFSLALGLVGATTLLIGLIFKWMFPEFPWALAFAFGAIVSPPDAISATAILRRFTITTRLQTLLEGESMINDASALILYKLAVIALLAGSFSFYEGAADFIQMVGGGIIIGTVLGITFQLFSRNYLQPVLGVVFSFTIPYITYITAHHMDTSGVLAVVVNGLIGSRVLLMHSSSLRRVLGYAVWDIFVILLNCFVFILIGLQLRSIAEVLTLEQMALYSVYGAWITLSMIAIRMLWVYAKSGFHYLKNPTGFKLSVKNINALQEASIVGWSGMRGIVSLAAAIALPSTYVDGSPIEGRNEIIFITFVVILLTLLIPGTTLPILLRWLRIQRHPELNDMQEVRRKLEKIADQQLRHMLGTANINEMEFNFLREYFVAQMRVHELTHIAEHKVHNIETARLMVIQAQRKHLLELWKLNEIDDKLLNHLENELDMIEVHIARAELK